MHYVNLFIQTLWKIACLFTDDRFFRCALPIKDPFICSLPKAEPDYIQGTRFGLELTPLVTRRPLWTREIVICGTSIYQQLPPLSKVDFSSEQIYCTAWRFEELCIKYISEKISTFGYFNINVLQTFDEDAKTF